VAADGRGAAAMLPSTIGGAGTAAAIVATRRNEESFEHRSASGFPVRSTL
jgi:hypothetical protein